jgi:hypothetical protein
MIVLPALYALGVFTFARLVVSSMEDLLYGRAINYYLRGEVSWQASTTPQSLQPACTDACFKHQ